MTKIRLFLFPSPNVFLAIALLKVLEFLLNYDTVYVVLFKAIFELHTRNDLHSSAWHQGGLDDSSKSFYPIPDLQSNHLHIILSIFNACESQPFGCVPG